MEKKKAYLLLANGQIFEGRSFGQEGTTIGEVVFTTGMTGYQETLTDPSYFGQIAVQTFPLIGNYGINHDDFESEHCWLNGYMKIYSSCKARFQVRGLFNLSSFVHGLRRAQCPLVGPH